MSSPQLSSVKNYKIEKFIDAGAFGAVFKIVTNNDHKIYALKQINLQKIDVNQRAAALSFAKNEYHLHRKGIPNVLRSFGSHLDPNEQIFQFSTEFMEMNLGQLIENQGPLSFERFIPIFRDLLSGS